MKNSQIIKMFEAKQNKLNRAADTTYRKINKMLQINKPTPAQTTELLMLFKEYDVYVASREQIDVVIRQLKKLDKFNVID